MMGQKSWYGAWILVSQTIHNWTLIGWSCSLIFLVWMVQKRYSLPRILIVSAQQRVNGIFLAVLHQIAPIRGGNRCVTLLLKHLLLFLRSFVFQIDLKCLFGRIEVRSFVKFPDVVSEHSVLVALIFVYKLLNLHHHTVVERIVLRSKLFLILLLGWRWQSLLVAFHLYLNKEWCKIFN
jgi:hypothetical protein